MSEIYGLGFSMGEKPKGTISITSNGSHDVTKYATANVNVIPSSYYIKYSNRSGSPYYLSVKINGQTYDFRSSFKLTNVAPGTKVEVMSSDEDHYYIVSHNDVSKYSGYKDGVLYTFNISANTFMYSTGSTDANCYIQDV